eukprot:1158929-Pelagomonas_calceolata.AAC.2
MGCAIKFTPLLGTGPDQPVCGLLEIDGVTLLMNCGWNEQFEEQLLEPVIRCALKTSLAYSCALVEHVLLKELSTAIRAVLSCVHMLSPIQTA